jgi:hypothetical protein
MLSAIRKRVRRYIQHAHNFCTHDNSKGRLGWFRLFARYHHHLMVLQ